MNTPLAAFDELEMLHRVRYVDDRAVDLRIVQPFVQEASSGPDKRQALQIFIVTRLFSDEDYLGVLWSSAKNDLRRMTEQVASLAIPSRFA